MFSRNILIFVHADADPDAAVAGWMDLGHDCRGLVVLVHVEKAPVPIPLLEESGCGLMIPGPPAGIAAWCERERRWDAASRLAGLRAQLSPEWRVCERIECGNPVDVMCRLAGELDAMRIVLMWTARGRWGRWLRNRTARRIFERSRLPVFCVGTAGGAGGSAGANPPGPAIFSSRGRRAVNQISRRPPVRDSIHLI